MGGTGSTHGRDEKCIQYFGWNTRREGAGIAQCYSTSLRAG